MIFINIYMQSIQVWTTGDGTARRVYMLEREGEVYSFDPIPDADAHERITYKYANIDAVYRVLGVWGGEPYLTAHHPSARWDDHPGGRRLVVPGHGPLDARAAWELARHRGTDRGGGFLPIANLSPTAIPRPHHQKRLEIRPVSGRAT